MKITLIFPQGLPVFHKIKCVFEPTGLLYLAGMLCEHHDFQIIDCFDENLTITQLLRRIERFGPDIVGISTIFSPQYPMALNIARKVKAQFPETMTILGGNHVSFVPADAVQKPYIDLVVTGEGELTFKELVERLDRGQDIWDLEGIAYLKEGTPVITNRRPQITDLDALPIPPRTLLPKGQFVHSRTIIRSRGCPFPCGYCSTAAFWGRNFRVRSPENVFIEMEDIVKNYSQNSIMFWDDNFLVSRRNAIGLFKLLIERKLIYPWGCNTRLELVDEEVLELMAEAGCQAIFFGIESGSTRVLQKMQRAYTAEDVKRVVEICNRVGIVTKLGFMIGLPYESPEDIQETFKLMREVPTYYVQLRNLTPMPGTPFYENAKAYNLDILYDNPELMLFEGHSTIRTAHLDATEITRLYYEGLQITEARSKEKAAWFDQFWHPERYSNSQAVPAMDLTDA